MAGLAFLGFLVYLLLVLRFDMFRSDVRSYWMQSFEWRSPFSAWWVPGYSLVIAAARGLTLGRLPPLAVMLPIACVAYLIAVGAIHRITRQAGAGAAFELGLLFALFPLVGLTYAVYPISDIVAIAVFLLAVLEMQRDRWVPFVAWCAVAMLMHKVMWFFVPPLLATVFVRHPKARAIVPLAFVPLLAWIAGGAAKFHSLMWFLSFNVQTHTVRHGLPVLGGLVETLQTGSPAKLLKGVVILTTLVVALATVVLCLRRRLWAGVWIAAVVAFLVAVVNAYEIWIAVRYSKLLVVAWCLLTAGPAPRRRHWLPWPAIAMLIATLMASNLAYGYYLAHYFHEAGGH